MTCEHDLCGDVDLQTVTLGAAHSHPLPLPRLVGGHSALFEQLDGSTLHQRAADAETTRSRSQVLDWLFECERTQISHSFALLKQVRWWQEPVLGWEHEYRRLGIGGLDCWSAVAQLSFLFV